MSYEVIEISMIGVQFIAATEALYITIYYYIGYIMMLGIYIKQLFLKTRCGGALGPWCMEASTYYILFYCTYYNLMYNNVLYKFIYIE
jgi:hypothetical protein